MLPFKRKVIIRKLRFFNYLPLRNIGLGVADRLKFVFLSYYVMYLKICFPSLWRKKCKIHYWEMIVHFKYDVKIRTLQRNLLAHELRCMSKVLNKRIWPWWAKKGAGFMNRKAKISCKDWNIYQINFWWSHPAVVWHYICASYGFTLHT